MVDTSDTSHFMRRITFASVVEIARFKQRAGVFRGEIFTGALSMIVIARFARRAGWFRVAAAVSFLLDIFVFKFRVESRTKWNIFDKNRIELLAAETLREHTYIWNAPNTERNVKSKQIERNINQRWWQQRWRRQYLLKMSLRETTVNKWF